MNRREWSVVLLLVAALVAGVGIAQYKRARLARAAAANPIVVTRDSGAAPSPDSMAVSEPVDINRATARQLEMLPDIGPVLAAKIIEYRRRHGGFRRVSELRAVPGIGPKRYAALVSLVVAGPSEKSETRNQKSELPDALPAGVGR